MDIKKTFRKALLERQEVSDITFQPYQDDEDGFGVKAIIDNKRVGYISGEEVYDAYSYDLDDVMSEEEFDELFGDDMLIKLSYLEVKNKNQGIGSELVNRFMVSCHNKGYRKFYLNASPMGFGGLSLGDLILFYRKFGFEVVKHQGGNAIMVKV